MPTTTGIVTTTDGYPANQESGVAIVGPFQSLATVQFTVTGASVVAQVAKMQKNSRALYWDQLETVFPPGQSGFTGVVHGIRFRSFNEGSPATVVINGYFKDDPVPFTNPQSVDYTLNPDGTIVPVGGSGIVFDSPNEGGSLQVTTDGADGMDFEANNGPIVIETNSPGFDLTVGSAANFTQNAVGSHIINAGAIARTSGGNESDTVAGERDATIGGADIVGALSIAYTTTEDLSLVAGKSVNVSAGGALVAGDPSMTVEVNDGGTGGADGNLQVTVDNEFDITSNFADIFLTASDGGGVGAAVRMRGSAGTDVGYFGCNALGFDVFALYDATPVVQQATPVTLADVILAGRKYGFWP